MDPRSPQFRDEISRLERSLEKEDKPTDAPSVCSIAAIVFLGLTFAAPFVLVPKNSEFTGAAAIVMLCLIGGGITSLILCGLAFRRRERLRWLAGLAFFAAFVLVAGTTKL